MVTNTKDFINRGTMPLVGREAELRVLLEAFNGLLEGEPRAVWMTGPAGVGKSRLLDELKEIVRNHTARSLVVHAKWYEGEGIEFGPLSNALEILKPVIAAPIAARIFREGAVINSEAAVEAVQVASRRYPVVMIFDDLHYLDSSVELDKFIGALEEIPVLVVVTTRPVESTILQSFKMAIGRSIPPQELEIGSLDGAGIAEAATALFGSAPPEEMLGQIAALSAGVPLALREVFREMIAAGHIALEDSTKGWEWKSSELSDDELKEIGDRVHGFSGRLASLPEGERGLLSLAGYLGEQFNRDLLRRLAEKTVGWDDHLFERLILSGLVAVAVPTIRLGTRDVEGRVCYAFTHTLLWKAAAGLDIPSIPGREELATITLEILTSGTGELYAVAPLEGVDLGRLKENDLSRLFNWLIAVGRKLAPIYAETFVLLCKAALEPYRSSGKGKELGGSLLADYLGTLTVYGERLYVTGARELLHGIAREIAEVLDCFIDPPGNTEERVNRLEAAVVVWHDALMQGDSNSAQGYLNAMLETLPPPAEQTDRELRGAAEAIRLRAQYSFDRGEFAEAFDLASPYITELDRMRPETLNALMKVLLYAMMSSGHMEDAREMVEAGLRLRHEADLFTAYELLLHAANYSWRIKDLDSLKVHAEELRSLVDRYPAYRGLSTNFWHLPYVYACQGNVHDLDRLEREFFQTPRPARSTPMQTEIAKYRFLETWNYLGIPDRALKVADTIRADIMNVHQQYLVHHERLRAYIDRRTDQEIEDVRELLLSLEEQIGAERGAQNSGDLLFRCSMAIAGDGELLKNFFLAEPSPSVDDTNGFRAGKVLLEIAQNSPGAKREYNDAAYNAIEVGISTLLQMSSPGLIHHHLDLMKDDLPKTRLMRFRQSAGNDPREQGGTTSGQLESSTDADSQPSQILRTFGALRVEGGDESGTKIESKTRSLVGALVVAKLGDTRWIGDLTRDRLADLLWPDMDIDRAANNLHATTSYARRFLGGSGTIRQRDGVYELSDDVRIDAFDFRGCIRKANRLYDEGVYFGAAVAYRQAIESADGDFLEGMYAEWIDNMRENLRGELATALERLIDIEIDRENFQAIPPLAERLLGLDDLHDGAYEALIRSAATRGARREAFTYYKRYENALDEYGAGPTRKISELIEKVRAGEEIN